MNVWKLLLGGLGEMLRRAHANARHLRQAWRDAPVPAGLWEDERAFWEKDRQS